MHIVWLILKILLIVILSLVGLVVLLALLVLFAPVRYRAYVKKDDDIFAKLSARWLGFVLCFKVLYDSDGLRYRLRLFGGTIMGSEKSAIPESEEEVYSEPGEYSRAETEEEASDSPGYEDYPSVEPEDRQFLLEDSEFEEPVLGPLIRLGRRIDSMAKTVVSKFKDLSEKFASLKKKKDGYTKLVHNVRTKEAMRVFKVELIKVLKHLKPTKLKGQIIYGADDPATTGERLGYMSLLFPLYYDNIDITPDFSEARLEGDLFMKGRIRLGTIGWSVLKVIWNKNVKITIARLKKISGGN